VQDHAVSLVEVMQAYPEATWLTGMLTRKYDRVNGIRRGTWKGCSTNFALRGFSEVRPYKVLGSRIMGLGWRSGSGPSELASCPCVWALLLVIVLQVSARPWLPNATRRHN
jgi:hypothetical protein